VDPAAPDDSRSFVRLVAIADSYGDPGHPLERSLVGPGELARLYCYASDRRDVETIALRFVWNGCGDNSFSDHSGNILLVADTVVGSQKDTLTSTVDRYSGLADSCLVKSLNPPLPIVKFHNLEIDLGGVVADTSATGSLRNRLQN
jgi:hypothetical protein